jgi:hypothetical protein
MPPRKDIYKDGEKTQFSSENQPENRGRKPSALRFIRDQGLSITDVKKIIGGLIWDFDSVELEEKLKTVKVKVKGTDGKTKTVTKLLDPVPMGVNIVLGALAADQKAKSTVNFDRLMDRAYGKPTQKDIIEFSDIPETAKDRLDRIFGEAQMKSGKIKPKLVSKVIPRKKGTNEG